jgi:rhodanese-related sulfurtransferase
MKKLVLILIFAPFGVLAQDEFSLTEKVKSVLGFTAPLTYVEDMHKMKNVFILDAREREEFDVSHLPGAIHVGDKRVDMSLLGSVTESDTIIVYCTVGYRSEKVAEKLRDAGYTNTFNLFGGIFAWKNDGGKVVDRSGRSTEKVHCYNKSWSLFLLNGEKVY